MDRLQLEGQSRRGETVRQARIARGYTNRENFAEVCNVSTRVLSDFESGARSNFSERVISRIEEALQWPAGTIEQIASDPNFTPPAPVTGGDLIFQPPAFDRRPVATDVPTVERGIAALTEASRSGASGSSDAAAMGAALVALCWPYVLRLVEDNCLPGNELHPAVRPLYSAFIELADEFPPQDPSQRYAQWLAGDAPDVTEPTRERYLQRWMDSRRVSRGRSAPAAADTGAADDPLEAPAARSRKTTTSADAGQPAPRRAADPAKKAPARKRKPAASAARQPATKPAAKATAKATKNTPARKRKPRSTG